MTTNPIFRGVATAIITPTNANGVDYESFGRIIDWQIAEGINAIVVCGTTGENPTLSDAEHKECIRFCVERVAGRVPVVAGTGSNDTAHAIEMTKYACSVGADARIGTDVHKYSSIPVLGAGPMAYVTSLVVNVLKGLNQPVKVTSREFSHPASSTQPTI